MTAKIHPTPPANKYERVLVAAKEARRLNEWDAQLIERPYRRLCDEAITKVDKGEVRYTFEPPTMPPAPPSVPNPLLAPTPPSAAADAEEEEE